MVNKFCEKCGSEIPEDAKFCIKCGQPFNKDTVSQQKNEHKVNKKTVYALLGTLGFLVFIVLGAMLYSEYSEAKEARLAREKYIADSLEQVRKDSIRLAKQKELERIEAKKMKEKEQIEAKVKERLDFILSKVVGAGRPSDKYFTKEYITRFNKEAKEIDEDGGEPLQIWWQYTDCEPEGYQINELKISTNDCANANVRIEGALYDVDFEVILKKVNNNWLIDKIIEKDIYPILE